MKLIALLASILLVAACAAGNAQRAHPVPSSSLAQQDRDFLARATEGNLAAVAMAGLAETRTKNAAVLALAETVGADHAASQKQLAAIASAKKMAVPASLGEHQRAYDRLAGLKDGDFDREYVRVLIEEHRQALELYRLEATEGSDPALKLSAAAALPRLRAHLQHAEAMSR